MGSPAAEKDRDSDESPQHQVKIQPNLQNLARLAEAIPIFYRQSTIARNN